MKLRIKDVNNLQELLFLLSKQSFPVRLSYKILKLTKKIEFETEFYFKELGEIINKYATRDEKGEIILSGNSFLPQEDLREECLSEIKELESLIVEIPDSENIYFTLDEIEQLSLTPSELAKFEMFIKE